MTIEIDDEVFEQLKKLISVVQESEYDYYGNRFADTVIVSFAGIVIYNS